MSWDFLCVTPVFLYLLQTPVIPPTVSDQVRLWEMERDRLELSEGMHNYVCTAISLDAHDQGLKT